MIYRYNYILSYIILNYNNYNKMNKNCNNYWLQNNNRNRIMNSDTEKNINKYNNFLKSINLVCTNISIKLQFYVCNINSLAWHILRVW